MLDVCGGHRQCYSCVDVTAADETDLVKQMGGVVVRGGHAVDENAQCCTLQERFTVFKTVLYLLPCSQCSDAVSIPLTSSAMVEIMLAVSGCTTCVTTARSSDANSISLLAAIILAQQTYAGTSAMVLKHHFCLLGIVLLYLLPGTSAQEPAGQETHHLLALPHCTAPQYLIYLQVFQPPHNVVVIAQQLFHHHLLALPHHPSPDTIGTTRLPGYVVVVTAQQL